MSNKKNIVKLKMDPFSVSSDHGFFYPYPSHEHILSSLKEAVYNNQGIIVLFGPVGTGKTMLAKVLIKNELKKTGARTAYVYNPLKGRDLLLQILEDFGAPQKSDLQYSALVQALHEFVTNLAENGGRAIVVIDEAQALDSESLEEIRRLSNIEAADRRLLQIILVGQEELMEKLESHELRPLRQRIQEILELEPISEDLLQKYIQNRLSAVGGDAEMVRLDPSALRLLHSVTNGIPRAINVIMSKVMKRLQALGETEVTKDMIYRAMQNLRIRPATREASFFPLLLSSGISALRRPFNSININRGHVGNPSSGLRGSVLRYGGIAAMLVVFFFYTTNRTGPGDTALAGISAQATVDDFGQQLVQSTAQQESSAETLLLGQDQGIDMKKYLEIMNGYSEHGLIVMTGNFSFQQLLALNTRSIVGFTSPTGATKFAVLEKIEGGAFVVTTEVGRYRFTSEELMRYYNGKAQFTIPNTMGYTKALGEGSSGEAVLWCSSILRDVGYLSAASPKFTVEMKHAVLRYQRDKNLNQRDGLIGPETLIYLWRDGLRHNG